MRAALEQLFRVHGTWRKVGVLLGYPEKSAQQTVSAAVKRRAGREVADKLWEYLETTNGGQSEPPQPRVDRNDLSANATEAMNAFTWDGISASEYDRVHVALAQQHAADGIDRVPSWWTSEIKRILAENRPLAKSVHQREPVETHAERDAREDRENEARKAEAKAKREAASKKASRGR